mgnify:CR=1 FL=1
MREPMKSSIPIAMPDLTMDGLCYRVEEKDILHGLTASIRDNRIGIVGRNGSGKSTLARLITGLISPTAGTVRLNGTDLSHNRKAALSEVGILFQNPDHQIIFPTVEEEIGFGLRQQGRTKDDATATTQHVLDQFGKPHWAQAHVSTLSQGQKHLVCLMSVVAMRPNMIVLDEPFTGLDIPTKAQLVRYLSHYQGGLIHITHDPADLAGYGQVIWLEKGTLTAVGDAHAVLADYTAEMTKQGGLDDISDLSS